MCLSLSEAEISSIVEAGGGKHVGVQDMPGIETLVLFISPNTRTTLAVPISDLDSDTVRQHIAESDAVFARGSTE